MFLIGAKIFLARCGTDRSKQSEDRFSYRADDTDVAESFE